MSWFTRLFIPASESASAERMETATPDAARVEVVAAALSGEPFEARACATAEDTVEVLFTLALPTTPVLGAASIRAEYSRTQLRWKSRGLVSGSEAKVRAIVLANLRQIQAQPGFKSFWLQVYPVDGKAQVNASVGGFAVPVAMWRSSDAFYACGNAAFQI